MTMLFVKKEGGIIKPIDELAEDELLELANGEYKCELTKVRNIKFLRKFFALLNEAFKIWEPELIDGDFETPRKSFDRFRKDLCILAGFYHQSVGIDGRLHFEAESISFANMDDVKFEKVYNQVLNVILSHVLKGYSKTDLEERVNRVLGFS